MRYFNYSDPDTGEKFDGVLTEISWFDERLEGKYVYLYGVGLDNFCWVSIFSAWGTVSCLAV